MLSILAYVSGPLYVLLGKYLFKSFTHFLIGLLVFLVWSPVSSLYILEINIGFMFEYNWRIFVKNSGMAHIMGINILGNDKLEETLKLMWFLALLCKYVCMYKCVHVCVRTQ